jgi:hypothetical protein
MLTYEIRSELDNLGLTVKPTPDGLSAESNRYLTRESFPKAIPLLARLARLRSLDLKDSPVANLEPLRGLIALKQLSLMHILVANLEPLRGLIALEQLSLRGRRTSR